MHKRTILIICAAALLLRLILALQAPALDHEAYNTIRQADHIHDTGLPLLNDPLAPDENIGVTYPLFAYIIAFSTLFLPDDIAYLIVPNIIAVTLHAALYLLILELTSNHKLSTIGATASIFIPSYLAATLLTLSSLALAIPLFVTFLTLFLKLRKTKENRNVLLLVFIALAFAHPISLLCIPFLIISIILAALRRSRDETIQQEFALFAAFFLIWLYILIYREYLATIGIRTLFGNLPPAVVQSAYAQITLPMLAATIGIVPLGLALYAAYREGVAHHVGIQATIALAISTALVMILKLVPLTTGLALFGVVCIALAAVGLQRLQHASKGLKQSFLPRAAATIMVIAFVLTSMLSTVAAGIQATRSTPSAEFIEAAQWLSESSQQGSIVLTEPANGYIIQAVAQRPVYINENYLALDDAEQRYENTRTILASSRPGYLARQHHIEYIVSDHELTDTCLNTVYRSGAYVAKVLCK